MITLRAQTANGEVQLVLADAELEQLREVLRPPDYISADELARALGVSKRTIDTRTRRKLIPFLRIGNRRRFNLRDVVAALRSKEK